MTKLPLWITSPDRPEAVQECIADMISLGETEVVKELKERTPGVTFTEGDQKLILVKAKHRALEIMQNTGELQDRASKNLAYQILRSKTYMMGTDEEENFEVWLVNKMGEVHSPGAISELAFMLELLETFETMGQGQFVEDLFKNRKGFAKFAKSIPFLREKRRSLTSAITMFTGKKEILAKQTKELKTKLHKAKEEDRPKIQGEIKQAEKRLAEINTLEEEGVEKLQENLTEGLRKAVALAKNPNVQANEIPSYLYNDVEIDDNGVPSTELEPDLKPIAEKAYVGEEQVVYMIHLPRVLENYFERMYESWFDIHVTDADAIGRSLISGKPIGDKK